MAAKPPPPATVKDYLAALPPERASALRKVRAAINKGLPKGYKEGIQYGMIGWFVPHSRYPAGYHCDARQPLPFASLASQKHHMAIYLLCIYGNAAHRAWFEDAWKASGHKLDMGKGCVRFTSIDDVPLDVVTEAIARVPVDAYVAEYERNLPASKRRAR